MRPRRRVGEAAVVYAEDESSDASDFGSDCDSEKEEDEQEEHEHEMEDAEEVEVVEQEQVAAQQVPTDVIDLATDTDSGWAP
jgi:hypothetical protein